MDVKPMKKKEKGSYGYIRRQQFLTIIRTVILFALSLGLYATGLITTGSNKNLLTVIAVLGLLPAAKSMVNMIMFLRFRSLDPASYAQYESALNGVAVLYENILTTKEQAYYLPVLACSNHTVCAYCPGSGELKELESHIRECVRTEGIDISVKIFANEQLFLDRLPGLSKMLSDALDQKDTDRIFAVIKAVSL